MEHTSGRLFGEDECFRFAETPLEASLDESTRGIPKRAARWRRFSASKSLGVSDGGGSGIG